MLFTRGAMDQTYMDAQSIIEDIYAGTIDEQIWHRAILSIIETVGGASASLTCVNPRTSIAFRSEVYKLDREVFDMYVNDWFDHEIRFAPALHLPAGEPFFEKKLLPTREWKRSAIYNELLCRIDRPWFLCFWLHKTDEKLSALAIHSGRVRGPFDEHDGERIQPFIPHLQRALNIRDRLESSRLRTDMLATTIDQLPFGIIVLDGRGRILECSAMASALMTPRSGIARYPDGTLRLRGPAGAQLDRWILGGTPPLENPDGLLRTHGPDGNPVSIMAMPVPVSTPSWLNGDAGWMLLVFDPARHRPRVELIGLDLDISPREAELAALLAQGLDMSLIAARMGISLHTARTHLKTIFAKTGCCSQVELIRRILGGPAGVLRQPTTPSG
jgi:DNA-binding CsgD family transcriptional regulator